MKFTAMRLLQVLHVFNDGYEASILLFLPFIAKELGITLTQVGLLGTTMNFLQVIFALPAGYLALRFGGVNVLIVAATVYSLAYFGVAIAPLFLLLLGMYFIAGIGFGSFHPVAFALVTRWSEKGSRGKSMGNFTAIGDVGRILISSLVTFFAAWIGWRMTSSLYGFVGLVLSCICFFVLRKRIALPDFTAGNTQRKPIRHLLMNAQFIWVTLARIFDSFASSSLFVFLPFLLLQKGVPVFLLGTISATYFIGNLLGKTLLGRWVDRFGNTTVFTVAEIGMAVMIVLLVNTSSYVLLVGFSVLLGALTKGTLPVAQTMVSEAVEGHGDYERSFGVSEFFGSIARMLAPISLGVVSDAFGVAWAFYLSAISALIAVLPALAFAYNKSKERRVH